MGQRANLVIVRGGAYELYYDHWCANALDRELLWGPEWATAYVERRDPVDPVGGWLDEVWAEGAAVVDHDRRVLLWFGGEDVKYDVALRRAVLQLFVQTWAGWEVRWAHGHIEAIADYLGVPRHRVWSGTERSVGAFGYEAEEVDWNDVLVTVRDDGEERHLGVMGDRESMLAGPTGLLPILDEAPRREQWSDPPIGGVHLDLQAREVWYWWAASSVPMHGEIRAAWSGWQVHDAGDRFEVQLERLVAPARLPVRSTQELQRAFLAGVRRVGWREGANPAQEVAKQLGQGARVSAATNAFRSSAGDPDAWERRLQQLEDWVGNRRVDDDGAG